MASQSGDLEPSYDPMFFTPSEWSFLCAACAGLIPADEFGPGAIDLHVPEFVDRHMQTPYAAGASWYREGPFFDGAPEFGYQGSLSLREILRAGIDETDRHCREVHKGRAFATLDSGEQADVLGQLERDEIHFDAVSARLFFAYLLGEVRAGYFADPTHGGNRDKAAWKMIGYPGMPSDYREWIMVRDRAYPLPPLGTADDERAGS